MSGLSSGAFFATQLHVAYSSVIKGAGIVAGGPYDCAAQVSYSSCMYASSPSITKSISNTKSWSGNQIDDIKYLERQKIYMISGTADTTVGPSVMNQLYKYYVSEGKFIPSENVVFKNDIKTAHTFPTDYDSTGNNQCSFASSPYISNCQFDGAGAILEHLYGTLQPKNTNTLQGQFIEFDQSEFIASARTYGMSTTAWMYVPKSCQQGQTCRLHIAFHGCQQGYEKIQDKFVKNTGYNKWADTNHIIVVYPQAVATNTKAPGSATSLPNPNGCWDWIGWYGSDFDVKSGKQLTAIYQIIQRITQGFNPIDPPQQIFVNSTTDNTVSLTWTSVADAHAYNVYRDSNKVNANPIERNSFTDENLQSGSTYTYYVTSLSSSLQESSPSNSINAQTTGEAPPIQPPTNINAQDITSDSITLTWTTVSSAQKYRIYRNQTKISDVTLPPFQDSNLNPDTQYVYEISSLNQDLESIKSARLVVKTITMKVCFNDNNYNHVVNGRATHSGGYVYALGSEQNIGLYNILVKTNLCMTKQNYYVKE